MFFIKNQGLVENKDNELRSVSPSRETDQNLSFTHTFVQTGASSNDCLERNQNSEITSTRDIDQIQNYSKVPTCTQVYTRKGNNRETIPNYSKEPTYTRVYIKKARMKDSNTENNIHPSSEENDPSKTAPNETLNEAVGINKTEQSNAVLLEKRTSPYPLSSYLTSSKVTNDYKVFLTML